MAYSKKLRRELMQEYLTSGEPLAEIARKHKIREATLCGWSRAEGWASIREAIETRALEKCIEDAATKLAKHNEKFLKIWDAFLAHVMIGLNTGKEGLPAVELEPLARVAEKAQRGQRVAMNADVPGEYEPSTIAITYTPLREHIAADGE